jgi:SAM-dependent methyltransferase
MSIRAGNAIGCWRPGLTAPTGPTEGVAMGWWAEQMVPRITEKACNTTQMRPLRSRQCIGLDGDVVEIGFGTGHNIAYLPPAVRGLWAVEPSTLARKYAQRRIDAASVPITFAGLDGQALDLPDDRFDHAVSTCTLCTIPDPLAALRELRRVLRPGGRFHFVEHGRSPEPNVARWQDRLDPMQGHLFAGCHINRPIAQLIGEAGFTIERMDHPTFKGPRTLGYIYEGVALVS